AILDRTVDLPMGLCLDTAHTFAAGYDISTPEGLEETVKAVDRIVGLDRVRVLHVNDSKTPLGSRVDRHENIGLGHIGYEAFRRILNHPRLGPGPAGLPGRAFILETPIDKPGDDLRNVRALWELAGISVKQAPKAEDGFSMVRAEKKPAERRAAKALMARKAKGPEKTRKTREKRLAESTAKTTRAAARKRPKTGK
ncbi:MAG: TIM barrel protein, partial [Candidatus Acidiferrales bacterium]